MSDWSEGEFSYVIEYKSWPITVEVSYRFYKGTTSGGGDDPSVCQIVEAIDGTGTNIYEKLPNDLAEYIEDAAFEKGQR